MDITTDGRFSRNINYRQAAGIVGAITVICWGVFVKSVLVPPGVQDVLAVFLFAIILWLTQAVPYVISGVLTLVLLSLIGGAPTFRAAATGFSSSLVYFLLLVFLLGTAIAKVDLDQWIASRLLDTSSQEPRPVRSLAGNLFLLAMVMPSAVARATTFSPVVQQLSRSYEFGREGSFEKSAFLILGHINTISSMALMTGGGMALVTAEIIHSNVTPITWLEWALLMIPPVVVLYALTTLIAGRLYGPAEATLAQDGDQIPQPDGGTFGSLTNGQRIVGLVISGTVILWILGSFSELPNIVPAALGVAVLTLPGIAILTAEDIADINWGILFIVGTMFSLIDHMEATGTLAYIVQSIMGFFPFHFLASWQSIGILFAFAVIVRTAFSTGSAALLVTLPVILRIGEEIGINQLSLALSVMLIIGSTTIFPFNTTAVLVSKEQGPLSSRDVATFGLLTMVCSLIVVILAWLVYWPAVRGLYTL